MFSFSLMLYDSPEGEKWYTGAKRNISAEQVENDTGGCYHDCQWNSAATAWQQVMVSNAEACLFRQQQTYYDGFEETCEWFHQIQYKKHKKTLTIFKQGATHHRDSDPCEALQWINVTNERLLLRISEPENKAGCLWCTDLFKLYKWVQVRKWVLR